MNESRKGRTGQARLEWSGEFDHKLGHVSDKKEVSFAGSTVKCKSHLGFRGRKSGPCTRCGWGYKLLSVTTSLQQSAKVAATSLPFKTESILRKGSRRQMISRIWGGIEKSNEGRETRAWKRAREVVWLEKEQLRTR